MAALGGRYVALSYFGLIPAALLGVDVDQLLDRAQTFAATTWPSESKKAGIQSGGASRLKGAGTTWPSFLPTMPAPLTH